MKKGISVLFAAILMISLVSCKGDESEKIRKQYEDLKSYQAEIKVTVSGNKGPMDYEFKQSYRSPDCYRAEVTVPERMAGTVAIIQGDKVWFRGAGAPAMPLEANTLDEEMDVLFPIQFLGDYFQQEPLPELDENEDGLIQLVLPNRGSNRYRFTQQLWIDGKTKLPDSFVTYDIDGNEMVRVEYKSFTPNIELEDSLFLP